MLLQFNCLEPNRHSKHPLRVLSQNRFTKRKTKTIKKKKKNKEKRESRFNSIIYRLRSYALNHFVPSATFKIMWSSFAMLFTHFQCHSFALFRSHFSLLHFYTPQIHTLIMVLRKKYNKHHKCSCLMYLHSQ